MIFQIIAVVFTLFAWSRALLRYKDKSITLREFFLWSVIWCSAITIILWPGLTSTLAKHLGIGRGADVIVYISIVLLYYLVFRLYIKISAVNHEITRLIRALALDKVEEKHHQQKL